VVGPGGVALFISVPRHAVGLDLQRLEEITADESVAWLAISAGPQGESWLAASSRLPDGAWLQVGKTTEARTALLGQFRRIVLWVVLIALVLGLAGGAWLSRRALRPIHRLIERVQHLLATGHVDSHLPVTPGGDEISRLARLFNTMLEKNQSLIRGMREALDNVAHELRTPLTRIRTGAELALQQEHDPAPLRDALLDSMEESERVLTMLNTLMDISEAQAGLMKLQRRSVAVAELCQDLRELFEFVAEERRIALVVDVPSEIQCEADPARLRQVLVNLVDNALKYTPPGGRVVVSARQAGTETAVSVQDNGPGIPPEELNRIWERLYRGDKSRSQRGLGLGLSLVKAITEAHGGRVEVESAPGAGAKFTVVVPAAAILSA
jgi:signal transduction histidine kinase